jgi:hypothetical protein
MGEGIIKRLLGSLRAAGDRIPDVRRGGNALMCAFAVFFFLYPSLFHFQRAMKSRRRRNNKVSCGHCRHVRKDGEAAYYHSAVAGAAARPGSARVIPVVHELIRNGDGEEKQDCGRNARKRRLGKHGKEHAWLSPTLLGDDLYASQPFCQAVLKEKLHCIFICKPDSHPWLYETVANSYSEEKRAERWDGHYHIINAWRRVNGVPLRDTKDAPMVNYICFEMKRCETGEAVYKNSWITDKEVGEENVEQPTSCGRARRKIENGHNNVLKNRDTIFNTISGTVRTMDLKFSLC